MDPSPRGRAIEKLDGDGVAVRDRGAQMESLGLQMRESASILAKIADGAEGKGYSMEKVRDQVGDLHGDLAKAGERYEPSGRVLREYGEAVVSVKTTIDTIVDECVTLWGAYETAKGQVTDLGSVVPPANETPEQKTAREQGVTDAQGDAATKYQLWEDEASTYDAPYDTWDSAYETAYNGLRNANDDGVEDSFWDDALPWVEGALTVLAVAGMVLAVLAIVIGGPIIALIAVIAGLVVLGLTIWKVAAGRGGAGDIGWAVVGIIPFGRLGQLGRLKDVFKGSQTFRAFAGSFSKNFLSDMVGLAQVRQIRAIRNMPGLVRGQIPLAVNRWGNASGMTPTRQQLARFADDWSNMRYMSPGAWTQRILYGKNAQLDGSIEALVAATTRANQGRLNTVISGAGLNTSVNRDAVQVAANVTASVLKPSWSAYRNFEKWTGAADQNATVDAWRSQLAANP